MSFLLYGANGYTGELIARESVRRGLRPILAGRNKAAVKALADELGLEYRIADLADTNALHQMLHDVSVALHCAGPYTRTSRPVVDACLRTQTHYLDLTGEIDVFHALHARDAEAQAAGVMLLPAVGFDVVPTDCLAALLQQKLPKATHLQLAVSGVGRLSHGTMKTIISSINLGGLVRENSKLHAVPSGWKTRTIPLGATTATAITMPLGDVLTAFVSTGIPNIETYVVLPASARILLKAGRFFSPLLATSFVQKLLVWFAERLPSGPSEKERQTHTSSIWGEVRDNSGHTIALAFTAPNVYTLTALASVAAVQRVLDGVHPSGFQTPSRAFGAELLTAIEGVELLYSMPKAVSGNHPQTSTDRH